MIVLTAIEKHYLLDLRSAARRAGVLISASTLLALLLTGLAALTANFEGPLFLNFFVLSLALVFLLPIVWERINRGFNQLVFLRQAGHERALERLERSLEGTSRLEAVEEAVSAAVKKMWGAQADILWVREALRGIEARDTLSEDIRSILVTSPQVYTVPGLKRESDETLLSLCAWLEKRGSRAIAPILREEQLVGVIVASAASQGFYDLSDLRGLRRIGVSAGRAVRSVELAQETLHADRLAQMGTLAAGIAHEVRNPLSAMLGAVELLDRDISEKERKEYIDVLKEEVRGLDSLVSELVDYSSPRNREASVEWDGAWERVSGLLKSALPADLKIEHSGNSKAIGVSGAHLHQILINLIKNAARATRDSSGTPRVCVNIRSEKNVAVLEVTDNGPGIPEDLLSTLFVPFETKSPGGTGLGLAMVRRLAELYGGSAWAENLDPGPGARFVVELPLAT
jgi:signal transduction histidine kinase